MGLNDDGRVARVVVVGSANSDLVCRVQHLPHPGETVSGGQFLQAKGGKGANQAVAAARLGADVTLVARVGADAYGDAAMAAFAAEGIAIDHIVRDREQPTGVALIMVDAEGENLIAVSPGANAALTPADIGAAADAIAAADVVLLSLEVPLATVTAAARAAHVAGAKVILNPAPAQPLPSELLALVDVLTPNGTEAAQLGAKVGSREAAKVAEALRGLGARTVVMTCGAKGCLVVCREAHQKVAAPAVEAVDTTACGDAFNGALGVALGEGLPLLDAVAVACVAGALTATKSGAQPSLPTRAEVQALGTA